MDRRSLLYSIVLSLLIVALGVVGVLVLRKRAALIDVPAIQDSAAVAPAQTTPPKKLPFEPAWQPGQPLPQGNSTQRVDENGLIMQD